jgi:NTE family protein
MADKAAKRRRPVDAPRPTKIINLALQGGGSLGAFAWGILDRLLEDGRIEIEGISATSAGSMNGTALAYGFAIGGRDGARQAIHDFWHRISLSATTPAMQFARLQMAYANFFRSLSPLQSALGKVTYLVSPYELNPQNINLLKQVVEETIDFEVLRRAENTPKLFLSATNVRNGKIRIFERKELTADKVLASACLPMLFQAVEIDGEHYWDGGYLGNPALYPLIYHCESRDILILHITPLERKELPTTVPTILNRINEISFNSSLMREMRAIGFVTKLIDDDIVRPNTLHRMFMHAITADDVTAQLGIASPLNAEWEFLTSLRDAGRRVCEEWLEANFDSLGATSTVDVFRQYL